MLKYCSTLGTTGIKLIKYFMKVSYDWERSVDILKTLNSPFLILHLFLPKKHSVILQHTKNPTLTLHLFHYLCGHFQMCCPHQWESEPAPRTPIKSEMV